jgi:hypothetical protein
MYDDDEDWKAAEAALERARRLPGGPERIAALRRAGQLRFAADRRRRKREQLAIERSSKSGSESE